MPDDYEDGYTNVIACESCNGLHIEFHRSNGDVIYSVLMEPDAAVLLIEQMVEATTKLASAHLN
jgi:hypothetical protein